MGVIKCFRVLAYISIASIINTIVDFLPYVPSLLTAWVGRGIMAATIFCMFQLALVNNRYKKAGLFRVVTLGCSLITSFLFGSYLLILATSVFSILAVYQEYTAHSELIAENDMVLSRKWRNLFYWEFATAIFLSFGSTMATIILVSSELQVSASRITGIVIVLLNIPRFVIDVVHFLYLQKTIGLLNVD